jgi:hypothetical protein
MPIVGTTTLARKFAQVKRYFLDYVFGAAGLVPTTGWSVTPVDAKDASLINAAVLQAALGSPPSLSGSVSGVTVVASPQIERQNQDLFNEVSDLGFDVVWSDSARSSAPTNVAAELIGIGVEYQPTRDLR